MEDQPIAAHGFGRGLAVDVLTVLTCGEVPEAVEVACPVENLFIVHVAALCELGVFGNLREEILFASPLHTVKLGIKSFGDVTCHKRLDEGCTIVTVRA